MENAKAFVLGFEAGEAAEQERIVKLLSGVAWASICKTNDESRVVSTRDLIALIKGENK